MLFLALRQVRFSKGVAMPVCPAHKDSQPNPKDTERPAYPVEFYGGPAMVLVMVLVFIALSGVIAIGFKVYTIEGLLLASFLSLVFLSLFSKSWPKFWGTAARGLTNLGQAKLMSVFLVIGVFSHLLMDGKIGQGLVWVSLNTGIRGAGFLVFAFLGTGLVAIGCGVPFAAIFTGFSIFYAPGIFMGCNPAILAGAIIGGLYFGDTLAPSSQLTFGALSTQTNSLTGAPADLVRFLKQRIPWTIGAGIICLTLLAVFPGKGVDMGNSEAIQKLADPRGLWMLIPIFVVVGVCLWTKEILTGLSAASLVGFAVGLATGLFKPSDIINFDPTQKPAITGVIMEGINSMGAMALMMVFLAGIIYLMKVTGAVDLIMSWLDHFKFTKTPWGAELIIFLLNALMNAFICGAALPSVLMMGEITQRVGAGAGLSPERRTLVALTSSISISGVVPFNSIFVLGGIGVAHDLANTYEGMPVPSAVSVFLSCWFGWLMTALCVVWILTGWGRTWEKDAEETAKTIETTSSTATENGLGSAKPHPEQGRNTTFETEKASRTTQKSKE